MNRMDSWDPVAMTFAIRCLDCASSHYRELSTFLSRAPGYQHAEKMNTLIN